jgi:hypothetical protein
VNEDPEASSGESLIQILKFPRKTRKMRIYRLMGDVATLYPGETPIVDEVEIDDLTDIYNQFQNENEPGNEIDKIVDHSFLQGVLTFTADNNKAPPKEKIWWRHRSIPGHKMNHFIYCA